MSSFWQTPKNLVGLAVIVIAALVLIKFIKPLLTLVLVLGLGFVVYQYLKKNN